MGDEPDEQEMASRVESYWRPYHRALADELDRLRDLHGHAVLLDAHSIRGEVPLLFEGRLPDLNLGSFGGASAAPGLIDEAMDVLQTQSHWSVVLDQRFRGGYNTRFYGRPGEQMHALQLEMAQSVYMTEPAPGEEPTPEPQAMRPAQALLRRLVSALADWRPAHAG